MFEDSVRNVAFAIVRFSIFGSGALLFGLTVVALLVLRPSFAEAPGDGLRRARSVLAHRVGGLVKVSVAVCATGTILTLLLQSLLIADLGGGRVDTRDLSSVLDSSFGLWHAIRLPLLLALAVLLGGRVQGRVLAGAGNDQARPPLVWWVAWACFGAGVLLTSSMAGHAAVSSPAAAAVASDLVHLAAGSVWFTGVVILAAVLPYALRGIEPGDRLALLAPSVVHFSRLALTAIAVIGVTGTINAFFNLEHPSDLFDSGYGRALSTKVIVFAGVLMMGGINHLYVRKRLRRALDEGEEVRAQGLFRKTIAAELVFGVLLLAMTGILVGSARTRQVSTSGAPAQQEAPDQPDENGRKKNEREAHLRAQALG